MAGAGGARRLPAADLPHLRQGRPGLVAQRHRGRNAQCGRPRRRLVSDLLLYLFGLSAYWWVALCLVAVAWGYRRLDRTVLIDRRPLAIALGGFVLLLLSSAALESLRLHTLGAQLPLAPGGMLGRMIGDFAAGLLGFTGATLLLLTLAAVGWSLFTGVSWLAVAELTGRLLEGAARTVRGAWEQRADRKAGEIAREERDVMVEADKKREEEHPPLVIAPPVAEIRRSERVQKEKQAPLFDHLPDTPLPPVKLLDEAAHDGEQVSTETLEFTSRLIEKKLSDFGVSVKVLAAYPGPGDHALRDRAGGRRQGQPDRQPGEGPGARAVGGVDPRGRDHSRQVVHGPGDPQPAPADRAPVGNPRLASTTPTCTRRSRSRWARTSPATRWWWTCRRCPTCWSPAPPARASRWRSTP